MLSVTLFSKDLDIEYNVKYHIAALWSGSAGPRPTYDVRVVVGGDADGGARERDDEVRQRELLEETDHLAQVRGQVS